MKAFQQIKVDVATDWGLILVGSGPQRKEIEDYVITHNIKDVTLPGYIQTNELCLFYALSDVFVLPSISEPWGLVVNEALASDLPVIVSNSCGCFPDIVRDGINGYSFDPLNESDLAQKMSLYAQGKANTISMGQSSQDILAEYTPDKIANIYHEAIMFVQSKDKI